MKPADILALLIIKPEDTPEISTTTDKPTQESIKYFQESIKYQAMEITTFDQNLCFLGMVLWASDLDPLNNGNPFIPPTDTGPAPINAVGKSAQITEIVCLYKYNKERFKNYCKSSIILISMITNKCSEKYMTNIEHRIIYTLST